MPRVKEGLEYYHSLYSPYNRTVQPRLFRHIRGGAKLNYVAGLTGYEKLCRCGVVMMLGMFGDVMMLSMFEVFC